MLTQVFMDVSNGGDLISEAFSTGICLGMAIGVGLICFLAVLYLGYQKASLKRYLLQADDNTRDDAMEKIRFIRDTADGMAVKTNTVFFRNLANQFHSLVAFIKRRGI